jgi:hypothetical protein
MRMLLTVKPYRKKSLPGKNYIKYNLQDQN